MIIGYPIFLLAIITKYSLCEQLKPRTSIIPVQIFSLSLSKNQLFSGVSNNYMVIQQKLNSPAHLLQGCKLIGSISQINLDSVPTSEFSFNYTLFQKNSIVKIGIFFKNFESEIDNSKILIKLDFLIGKFPPDYDLFKLNMTSFQQHVMHMNTRQYDLLFFLNGWNNLSLSGNISHGYQTGADMFTVHYMSCQGQQKNMGWRQGQDYLLFQLIVVPNQFMTQKFRLTDKLYSLDYTNNIKYFYGIKGSLENKFVGAFYQRIGGVAFKTQKPILGKTYGLSFLKYQDNSNITDERINQSQSAAYIVFFICIGLLLSGVIYLLIRIKFKTFSFQLNEQSQFTGSQSSQISKNEQKCGQSKQKYNIHTVQQVDQKYEASLKGSYNPKIDEEPSLNLQQ